MSLRDCDSGSYLSELSDELYAVNTSKYDLQDIAEKSAQYNTGIVSCVVIKNNGEKGAENSASCLTARIRSIFETDFNNEFPFMFLDCNRGDIDHVYQNNLFLRIDGNIYKIGYCENSLNCNGVRKFSGEEHRYCISSNVECNELNQVNPTYTVEGSTTTKTSTSQSVDHDTTLTSYDSTTVFGTYFQKINVTSVAECTNIPIVITRNGTQITISNQNTQPCSRGQINSNMSSSIASAVIASFMGLMIGATIIIGIIMALKSEVIKVPKIIKEVNKKEKSQREQYYFVLSKYYGLIHTDYNEALKFSERNLFSRIISYFKTVFRKYKKSKKEERKREER